MKVVILAGGRGTRMGASESCPKPLVRIKGHPAILNIMNFYARQGFDHFIIGLGFGKEAITQYFLSHSVSVNCQKRREISLTLKNNWTVVLIDTGLNSEKAERLVKLKPHLTERFFLSWCDVFCDVNLKKYLDFHRRHNKLVTVVAVRPSQRYGYLRIKHHDVIEFCEKDYFDDLWVNGGYYIVEPGIFDFINRDDHMWEENVKMKLCAQDELAAYPHDGFWHAMDYPHERDLLEMKMGEHDLFSKTEVHG